MSRTRQSKPISGERKAAFYIGGAIMLVGLILFGSTFLLVFGALGGGFGESVNIGQAFVTRAFGGFVLIVIGSGIRKMGARGLAGSGMVLDPEQARDDLSPYSRMAGGMVRDALDEADVDLGQRSERVVVIKCRKCSYLNEENSKFCQECGDAI